MPILGSKKTIPLDAEITAGSNSEALTTALIKEKEPSTEHNEQREENAGGGCFSFLKLFSRKKLAQTPASEAQIPDDKYRILKS